MCVCVCVCRQGLDWGVGGAQTQRGGGRRRGDIGACQVCVGGGGLGEGQARRGGGGPVEGLLEGGYMVFIVT